MKKLTEYWLKIRYSIYSPLYDPLIGRLFTKLRQRSISLAQIRPEDKVLIIGAGTGLDLEFLKQQREIIAIDISSGMLNKLKKRAKNLGIPVKAEIMDARNLDFANQTFNVIILHMIVAVVPDYIACLREVNRVLGPNGRVMVLDKFLPHESRASWVRRIINPLAIAMASDLNMKVEDLTPLNLSKVSEEKVGIFRLFRIIKFVKENAD